MSSRRRQWLVIVAIVTLAVNLRPAAVSVGPVLDELRSGLDMGSGMAGFVTTLPVLCFAGFGGLAPRLARALGIHRVMLAALIVTGLGLAGRAVATDLALFVVATVPALAGMAAANVLLPSLVKLHFPDRIGLMTAVYTTALASGLTAGSALTVPVAQATGSWRGGLGVWALLAAVAVVPWLGLVRRDLGAAGQRTTSMRRLLRSRLAWATATFFGIQSLQAYSVFGWLPQIYRDAGFSAESAGLLLAVVTGTSIPSSLVLPRLAVHWPRQRALVLALCGSFLGGYLGLLFAPGPGAWAWALLIGVGTGLFPLVLTLIGLRSRTPEATAALSGFAQGIGYLLSAAGPVTIGLVYGATGGWTVPLLILIVLLVPQAATGVLVGSPGHVEDELAPPSGPALLPADSAQ